MTAPQLRRPRALRRRVAAVGVGLAGLAGGLVAPGVSVAQLPPSSQDYAVTLPTAGTFRTSHAIDARSGPSGEDPTGTVERNESHPHGFGSTFLGSVTCLAVTGNRAVIGSYGLLTIRDPFDPPPPENRGQFTVVEDNGPFVFTEPLRTGTGPNRIRRRRPEPAE